VQEINIYIYWKEWKQKHFDNIRKTQYSTEATLTFEYATGKAEIKEDTEWLYLNYPPVHTEYFHLLKKT
jgi:hypothetical protein